MTASARRGLVYVAVGDQYIREACQSASAAKDHQPDVPIYLLCNAEPPSGHCIDIVEVCRSMRSDIGAKLHMWRSPFEQSIFLDSDTRAVANIEELFLLFDRFDLFAHQSGGGYHYALPGVPDAFPEFNTGVVGFRKGEATRAFFDTWMAYFEEYKGVMNREWDQRSFRMAAWVSDARVAPIPCEWNFMPYFPQVVTRDVKVVHGRDLKDDYAAVMNRRMPDLIARQVFVPRAFVPRLGCLYHYNIATIGEIGALALRSAGMLGFEMGKRFSKMLRIR